MRLKTQKATLTHPKSMLAPAVAGIAVALVFDALAHLVGTRRDAALMNSMVLGAALLSLPLILEYRNARHELTAGGMRFGRMLGGGGVFRWSDVKRLSFSNTAKWFRIDLHDGRVARISAMSLGLAAFARAALEGAPVSSIEDEARTLLERTAAGSPPPIWH
jgi:hypothetical protein